MSINKFGTLVSRRVAVAMLGVGPEGAQLSQRDRAAGCISFGQKWKTGTGTRYFTIGLQSYRIRRKKKRKIRAIAPFKVIQGD